MSRPVHIYKFHDVQVYVMARVDETKINIKRILKSVSVLIPQELFRDSLRDIYVGKFNVLDHQGNDSMYSEGTIYISSEYINAEGDNPDRKFLRALVHEIGHAFEKEYYDDLYQGQDISRIELEFQDKKVTLFDILEDKGYDPKDEWLYTDSPGDEFSKFLTDHVGYKNIMQVTEDEVVSPYAYVSLSEYIVMNFQYYFAGNKSRVQEYSPEVYNFIETILDKV